MSKHRVLMHGIAGLFASVGLAATAMAATDVLVTDARVEAGKLIITGKTAVAGTRVRLDGRSQADFNAVSGRDRTFRFNLVYLPKDCIVSLQKVQGSQLGAATEALIANCAPSAISARGPWNEETSYEGLDLVGHGGASWLAISDKAKGEPGKSKDWQLFAGRAAGGEGGKAGRTGTGAAGSTALGAGAGTNPEAAPTGPAGGDLAGTYPNPVIAPGAVTTAKIASGAVTKGKIFNGSVITSKIANGAVTNAKIALGTITGDRIAPGTITATELATDSVQATEIQDDSIDSGEIVDFSLSNQDIGVLFAQVNADGTLANSSGTVTSSKLGTGTYEVDFGRNIASCAYVATQGEAGVGGAGGAIVGLTDRSGNAEAVFATTRTDANVLADRAFQLVVVC